MHGGPGRWIGTVASVAFIAAGCGRASTSPAAATAIPAPANESCWRVPAPQVPPESLTIVVHDRLLEGPGASRLDAGAGLVAALVPQPSLPRDCVGGELPPDLLRMTQDTAGVVVSARPRPVVATLAAGADARDALDAGADVLVTADPAAAEYAGRRTDLAVVELEPRWSYGLFVSGAGRAATGAPDQWGAVRRSLAGDVVPAAARASLDTGAASAACAVPARYDSAAPARRSRIVYRSDDPVARALAERLVSLAERDGSPVRMVLPPAAAPFVAFGSSRREYTRAFERQADAAYVVAWPRASASVCGPQSPGAIATVIPLIDVGQWLIVRRGRVGVILDASGDPRLVGTTSERHR